jgi:hypothetical protein
MNANFMAVFLVFLSDQRERLAGCIQQEGNASVTAHLARLDFFDIGSTLVARDAPPRTR